MAAPACLRSSTLPKLSGRSAPPRQKFRRFPRDVAWRRPLTRKRARPSLRRKPTNRALRRAIKAATAPPGRGSSPSAARADSDTSTSRPSMMMSVGEEPRRRPAAAGRRGAALTPSCQSASSRSPCQSWHSRVRRRAPREVALGLVFIARKRQQIRSGDLGRNGTGQSKACSRSQSAKPSTPATWRSALRESLLEAIAALLGSA